MNDFIFICIVLEFAAKETINGNLINQPMEMSIWSHTKNNVEKSTTG